MAPFTLPILALAALALANRDYSNVKTSLVPLSSDKVGTLKVDAFKRPIAAPPLNFSSVVTHSIASRSSIKRRWTVTSAECLDPSDSPHYEDCANICSIDPEGNPDGWLAGQQGPIVIQPWEIWYVEDGTCTFGIANLDPCEIIDIDPLGAVWQYCYSMYADCVYGNQIQGLSGYDGFLQGTDPNMAMALSGSPSAPPYEEGPCEA
jgi:hypothetical protein